MKALIKRQPTLSYFIFTFTISWGGLLVLIGPGGIPGYMAQTGRSSIFLAVVLVTLIGPILAGILTTVVAYGRQGLHEIASRLFQWRVEARWYAVALLTAPLTVFGALFALSLFSPAFVPGIISATDKLPLVVFALVVSIFGPLCEETGWTGFAIPHLSNRHGIFTTGLIVGIVWGAWHFLSNLSGVESSSQNLPVPLYMAGLLFSFLPPFRVLMVWVYDHTKSLFLAVIMHSSLDFFWLISMPTGIEGVNLVTWYLVWGALLWLVVGVVALSNRGQFLRHTPLAVGHNSAS